ncbi:3-oxoacyl-[acyl-carrier-protein] reductase [Dichotomicrobium thermohalophilum]|uniref:3-oxoacyl-[acyl-carrier-protein] reductase n=1 Tax=Dichotomicrobium thermohalophilum TaxID=933063 RepID=A0A397Q591_9HYPH|nr:3-oxoacyl-[acyl-carrier-protein] reductase [Dichotomicrobium thermohalophilum]RIA56476.1 3-oxoacyl-[acyl-carrier-protein] reductase [Dichotomicrobium thermohalophilum]
MFDLTGRCALVTGATGGIGAELAAALHRQGAHVALSGTRKQRLDELAAQLGERVATLPCDLSDRDAVSALPGQAEEALGRLDIVVNNAGITRDNLFMRMKDEEWDQVIQVNLTATFLVCRGALRGMMKRRFGRIINIASISGVIGNPGQGNYAASKAGMVGMTKSLAREVAPRGITANCIAPGFIETAMTGELNDKQVETIAAAIPSGTFGKPSDIAAAAVYLASNEAGYVTGETLHVNGGMAMV